ncbi:MAG TPA: TolC family protein, partial [Bryobacteraceae bacterium]|nr:TolC family protein [Bryobacteraceae bacterium]
VSRLTVEAPRNAILRAHSIFDPQIVSSFTPTRNARPVATRIIGDQQQLGADVASSLSQQFSLRGQQVLPTGTTYSVGYDANRFTSTSTDNQGNRAAPQIQGNLALNFTQPLLRNRGAYLTKLPITIARGRLKSTEFNIEDQILRLLATAENAYWDVVSARETLRVQEQSLALFGESLKRSQRELELGALSELEIFQPRAQYANAEIQVTQAKFRLQQAEDALRRQISADLIPAVRELPIVLTEDVAPPTQTEINRDDLINKALSRRPDLLASRQTMDITNLQIQQAANGLRPDLRLTANYGSFGRNSYFSPEQNRLVAAGLGESISQMFGWSYPVYGMGLQLTLPLRDRRASADYADAVVSKRLEMLRVRSLEQTARLEVLNAITQVENSKASIELAKISLDLAQKRVDADQKRFDLGAITMFFLLDAQTQLTQAQSALVNQTVQYRRNLTNLLRVTGDLLSERGIAIQ